MPDTLAHVTFDMIRVAFVTHRPTLCLQPIFEDLVVPLHAVESGTVAEDGGDVGWVVFLVPDEFESDGPEWGDGDEDEAWGGVDGVEVDVVGF
jgi:hypothetical protein